MDEFNEYHIPPAYLITFRCYATWLHGDERGSTDRHHNHYGTPLIQPSHRWLSYNAQTLKHNPVELDAAQRAAVETAIRETCPVRSWLLRAVNVRTNHIHIVVSSGCRRGPVLTAFKANATRKMKEMACWTNEHSPWSEGGSKRYLWTERSIERAIEYVVDGQGGPPPDFNRDP